MTDYDKLKSIIDDIDNLIYHHVRASVPAFEAWYTKAERFLIKKYGNGSLEHKKFIDTYFAPLVWCGEDEEEDIQIAIRWCRDALKTCKAIFETYLEDISNENELPSQPSNLNSKIVNRIFIVHGHSEDLKQTVARIIEKQGIGAIILSEQANGGRTIIEKFEDYSDVDGAICLFTADDIGKAKTESTDNSRARQNVVLETGYFMGKLGRNRVVILADKGVEMPSDLSGVVYTDTAKWEIALMKELKEIGYPIDLNKLLE